MIAFICGNVVDVTEGVVILECNGIGYEIGASNATLSACSEIGAKVQLFTYLHVKEDGISLYGFSTDSEKQMFLKLIAISGIGPKVALSILSGISVTDLAVAILNGDTRTLTSIKGLGKKTAERVILELREKVSPLSLMEQRLAGVSVNTSGGPLTGEASEALSILVSLGLSRNDAVKRVKNALSNGVSTAEEILNFCLKNR